MSPARDFDEYLMKKLKDPKRAASYLSAALTEGEESFLIALRQVSDAQGGVSNLAKKTKLGRQATYRMLSRNGNPTISSLKKVLHGVGIRITFVSEEKLRKAS